MRKNLQAARRAKGLTQEQMAEYLQICDVHYRRIELGHVMGRVEMWDKLEDFFGLDQRWLRENTIK